MAKAMAHSLKLRVIAEGVETRPQLEYLRRGRCGSGARSAVVDRERKGEVSITCKFEHIKGTSQVRVEHVTKFKRPTMSGTAAEEMKGASVLHVGRFGRLSLAQPSLLERQQHQGEIKG